MNESKYVATPAVEDESLEIIDYKVQYPFREAIGSMLYLCNKTRPDINYIISRESRYVEKPSNKNISAIKRVFRYLNGTRDLDVVYNSADKVKESIVAYCDSDFAGDIETRKSTTGFIIYCLGGPVAWCSRKQQSVAMSSTEAEYIAASECCKEAMYIKSVVEKLTGEALGITLNVDNQSTISLIKNGITNRRSKHIDVRYHFIHDLLKNGLVDIKYCPTQRHLADILTKPLERIKFDRIKEEIVK